MAERKPVKKSAAKSVKAKVANKTVKKPAPKKREKKAISSPLKMRVQTAEGWRRAKLKELEAK